jgi:hypothetical protein
MGDRPWGAYSADTKCPVEGDVSALDRAEPAGRGSWRLSVPDARTPQGGTNRSPQWICDDELERDLKPRLRGNRYVLSVPMFRQGLPGSLEFGRGRAADDFTAGSLGGSSRVRKVA